MEFAAGKNLLRIQYRAELQFISAIPTRDISLRAKSTAHEERPEP